MGIRKKYNIGQVNGKLFVIITRFEAILEIYNHFININQRTKVKPQTNKKD